MNNDVEKIVNEIIDDFLEREEKKREDNVFYPSEIPYCYRKNYYLYKCPKPITSDKKRIFEMGNIIHNFITLILRETFHTKLLDSERSVTIIADPEHDVDIRGRLDNLVYINNQDGSEKTIFEVKSTANIKTLNKPQEHHIMQLIPYLRSLQLKRGYIIYVEKNTLQVKVFEVEYDKEIFLKLVERVKKLARHIRENTLPEPEGKMLKDWQCSYCDYKDLCDKDFNIVK